MNYHKFSYLASQRRVAPPPPSPPLPPPSLPSSLSSRTCASGADHVTRYPIRVTPSALPLLVYAILYSIEFQAPTGPRALPDSSHRHSSSTSSYYKNNNSNRSGKGHKPHGQLRRSRGKDEEHVTTRTATAADGAGNTLSGQVLSAVSSFFARAASAGRVSGRCEKTTRGDDSSRSDGRGSGKAVLGDDGAVQVAAVATATAAVTKDGVDDEEDGDDVDEAVLQRLRAQPCVVPVTQIIHKLGGVYLVVRERHAASVETAKLRALQDVQAIVEQAAARRARQHAHAHAQQTSASNTTATTMRDDASVATSARRHDGGNDTQSTRLVASPPQQQQQQPQLWQQRDVAAARASGSRDGGSDDDGSNNNIGNTRCRAGSAGATATTAMMTALHTSSSSSCSARRGGAATVAEVHASEGEIGMELTVRLLTRATRWRVSYDERPLAEWCFAIIRTSNEDTIRYCGDGRTGNNTNNHTDGGAAGGESVVFVNDAAQIQDVLQFILKTFYEAISMETFADYTAGELVFDARMMERRSFA